MIVWGDYLKLQGDNLKKDIIGENNDIKIDKRKYILTLLGTTLGVFLVMKCIIPLVVPFVFAYFITGSILPFIRYIEKKFKVPKALSGGILLVISFSLFGWIFLFLAKNLISQILSLLRNLPVYQSALIKIIDSFCVRCDHMFGFVDGQARGFVDDNMNIMLMEVKNHIMPSMTEQTISIVFKIIGVTGSIIFMLVSVLLMIRGADKIKESYMGSLFYEDIQLVKSKLSGAGIAYFKAQLIIMSIISVMNVSGLLLLKNEYALLLGIGIALIDALPVLGSGTILIPWAIILLFSKEIVPAAVLITLYLLSQLIRQFMEPRLIGDRIGVNPIFTIMSIYVGIQIYGLLGFVLGPISLVIIKAIVEIVNQS